MQVHRTPAELIPQRSFVIDSVFSKKERRANAGPLSGALPQISRSGVPPVRIAFARSQPDTSVHSGGVVRSLRIFDSRIPPIRGLLLAALLLFPILTPNLIEAQIQPGVGGIGGFVRDSLTGEPIRGAQVRVRDVGRSDLTHEDGSYHLESLSVGEHIVVVQMLGYRPVEQPVTVVAGEEVLRDFNLEVSAISLAGIVVTGVTAERGLEETYRPTIVLGGAELDRQLSGSLAATLRRQQGLAVRSFGPAPAQPIIRGMGGDRVLVLEDGNRTGDLSSGGADHAVGVDPIGAERIEVVRGPAGLLYGSNALGGVINVIREEIPRAYPERTEATVALEGTSVNRGGTVAGSLLLPVGGRYALRGEASLRRGGDLQTPLGELPNTDSRGLNLALGASWLPSWGFAGASYRAYFLDHGIPGEFQGVQIPGGHPGGVSAETRRQVGRAQLGHFDGVGPFASLQMEGNLIHYLHREIEGTQSSGEPIIGTSFDQITATLNTVAHHEHSPGSVRVSGALGAFGSFRDLITGGSYSGARDARETNLALFLHEELERSRYRIQAGVRYDWIRVEPTDLRPIDTGNGEVEVRTRTFGSASASLAGLIDLREGWVVGAGVARAFRAPSVSELFSAGPHLADFSYDIGNPELGTETGLGFDLFLRVNRPGVTFEGTVFRNRISNFIHNRPTGETDPRFGRFPVFRAVGADALFAGADGSLALEVRPSLVVDGTVSYVQAEYMETGEPLPAIPPLSGSIRVRYEVRSWFLSVGWDGRASQTRVPFAIENPVPGEEDIIPERPTAGHGLMNVGAGLRWYSGELSHALTLTVDNALDRVWRDHLSRAREVAPEAGRNVQLLYRISF